MSKRLSDGVSSQAFFARPLFAAFRFRARRAGPRFGGEPGRVDAAACDRLRQRSGRDRAPQTRLLFDLVGEEAPWRLDRIVDLTQRARDGAAQRLKDKLLREAEKVHNTLVGRRDADEADKAARVRVTPLPSIGHRHADHAIRRILVEIPPNCPLRADDVAWAFSGPLLVSDDGEIIGELAPAVEQGMLAHYGVGDAKPARLMTQIRRAFACASGEPSIVQT